MSVDSVVPVNESFNVDNVACLDSSECIVNVGAGSGEVSLNAEVVIGTILSNGNVNVVSITGSIVLIGYALNGKTVECCELVLIVDKIVSAKLCGKILSGSNVVTVKYLEGSVNDFELACPFSLVTGNLYLGTCGELCGVFLGACHFINEVSAVFVCCINSDLVIPPGLSSLNVAFDDNLIINFSCNVICISHSVLCVIGGIIGINNTINNTVDIFEQSVDGVT